MVERFHTIVYWGQGDHHGCPYKTFDKDSLRAALTRMRIAPSFVDEAVAKVRHPPRDCMSPAA